MSAPRVVSKFFATGKNGSRLKFRIQDLSEQLLPEAVDCFMNNYVKHDVLSKAAGVDKSNEAMKEMRVLMHETLAKPSPSVITVVCLHETDTQDSLVGIISAILKSNNDEVQDLRELLTKEMRKLAEITLDLMTMYDVHAENPHIDKYYDDRGIAVHPYYRDAGLGFKMTNVHLTLCKKITKYSAGWMTARFTQNFFERQGFTVGCEVSFLELGRRHGVSFQGTPPTAKRMFGEFQLKDDIKPL